MNFINTYQKYFIIIFASILLGLFRWFLLDRNFPLIAEQQIALDAFISYQDINTIIKNESIPIIDARDFESYSEGFIGNAYNLDIDLLYELDQETIDRVQYIINKYGYIDNKIELLNDSYTIKDINSDDKSIVVYCWGPTCDRAEELVNILLDTTDYYGGFGKYFSQSNFSIYKGGWEEWDSIVNQSY